AGFQQAEGQGLLHRERIGAVVVADDDAALALTLDISAEPEAQRLQAEQVQLLVQNPADVVLAKSGGLDQRDGLELKRVGAKVGAGGGKHLNSSHAWVGLASFETRCALLR